MIPKSANLADFEKSDIVRNQSLPNWQTFKLLGYTTVRTKDTPSYISELWYWKMSKDT